MTRTVIDTSIVSSESDPIFQFAASGDELVLNAGVTLQSNGLGTILGRGDLSGLKATILGTVVGGSWAGLDAFSSSIEVTVGITGRLEGGPHGAMAIEASGESSLNNHGTIEDLRGFGVVLADITQASVQNDGYIFGEVGGIEFSFPSVTDSTAHLVNKGTIESGGGSNDQVSGSGSNRAVYSGAALTTIANFGIISAHDAVGAGIYIAGGPANIQNSGTITSEHDWGIAISTVDISPPPSLPYSTILNGGTISGADGAMQLGEEADTVTNSGTLGGAVMLGAGEDHFDSRTGQVHGVVDGGGGNDWIAGGTDADTIRGRAGDDTLDGWAGADAMDGGPGDDKYYVDNLGDTVTERVAGPTGGHDQVYVSVNFTLGPNLEDLTMYNAAAEGTGNELANAIVGNGAANRLTGLSGGNSMFGGEGTDLLRGGSGNDTLAGGREADVLCGGAGGDIFRFNSVADSAGRTIDTIVAGDGTAAFQGVGAAMGDRIDVSAIDANTRVSGHQHFSFGTSHATGHLWAVSVGSGTHIRGNIDHDAAAEFDIAIADGSVPRGAYTADDFIL